MQRINYSNLIGVTLMLLLTACESSPTPQQNAPAQQSRATPTPSSTSVAHITSTPSGVQLRHIFYIMLENHSTNEILGNTADAPYLNQLAQTYGVATHYYGVTHPSLPNYLAAISGDFQGIWDDCAAGATITCAPQAFASSLTQEQLASASNQPHMFNGQTIVDQLEAQHMTWKAYMQTMPSVGFQGESYGLYAQKHDPFMYFARTRNSPVRMQQIVPLTQLAQDLQAGSVANFVWITPDLCHDMHGAPGCSAYNEMIALGDSFVHTTVQQIMASPAWTKGSAIVIVWDENDAGSSGCCRSPVGVGGVTLGGADVPLIVVNSRSPHHMVLDSTTYNHYSLLATLEQLWHLGCLANTCSFNDSLLLTKLFE